MYCSSIASSNAAIHLSSKRFYWFKLLKIKCFVLFLLPILEIKSSLLISCSISLILFNSYLAFLVTKSFKNKALINFLIFNLRLGFVFRLYFKDLFLVFCFSAASLVAFVCFSKAFPKGEKVNVSCSITEFWSDGNIYWPVLCSYFCWFCVNVVL